MKCKETSERLDAYLDGELAPREALAVQAHLRECPRCAAELQELQRLSEAVQSLEGIVPPSDFSRRVRDAAEARRDAIIQLRPLAAQRLSRAASLIAALVMVVAGLWFGASMGHSAARGGSAPVETEIAEVGDFDLQLDPLSATPLGSVAELYLAFAPEIE